MREDIRAGATFPDYELPDHTGTRRRLSELQGGYPMILVLSRGHYCPKDRRQLRHLVDFYPELEVGYTRIALISTDTVLQSHEHRAGLGAQWPFLADPGRIVQKDLDIQEYTDPHHDPMIPHTLVLKPGLEIFKISKRSPTATGTGAAPRSRSCAPTCARSGEASAPTGTWRRRGYARRGSGASATSSSPMGRQPRISSARPASDLAPHAQESGRSPRAGWRPPRLAARPGGRAPCRVGPRRRRRSRRAAHRRHPRHGPR